MVHQTKNRIKAVYAGELAGKNILNSSIRHKVFTEQRPQYQVKILNLKLIRN